eukprot:Lithocolla_globosa_v1_NODE_376_length_4240_cov_6.331422.p2 type:complete len:105 gc:universal NODE_376_length_4240_cov_6.331422:949-635(-)
MITFHVQRSDGTSNILARGIDGIKISKDTVTCRGAIKPLFTCTLGSLSIRSSWPDGIIFIFTWALITTGGIKKTEPRLSTYSDRSKICLKITINFTIGVKPNCP